VSSNSTKQMQEWKRISGYARHNHALGRRETWSEQIDRVLNMHKEKYSLFAEELEPYFDSIEEGLKAKNILGSQRNLQFAGVAVKDNNAKSYNCTSSYCDRADFFQEAMWLLLCGTGVGFSVQEHHIAKLPNISWPDAIYDHAVEDSIEGWADAVGALMHSFFYDTPKPVFDYSLVRPAGALIRSSGGKAPGPDGLRIALLKVEELITDILEGGYSRLLPIDAYDIIMHLSDAVLSGGVRRSATVCLFSPTDKEMLNAKMGDWFTENPQRGRSNNSVVLLRDETTKEEFDGIMESVKEFGEPGFIWADDREALYNPCVEIGMYAYDDEGNSGWSFCNLCEMNPKKAKTPEDFYAMCAQAAALGTLQAGYTTFNYLGEATKKIVEREALLGVSMTGIMDNPGIALDPHVLRTGARIVKETNAIVAEIIGINQAARTTCVKPAGSTSVLLGTASGIHPHHSKRYFRRIQANKMEGALQFFKQYNPEAVEESVWSSNGTDEVITFCCEVPKAAKTKVDTDGLELLGHVKTVQENWVQGGKNHDLCVKPWLSHNVSNTIHVRADEWQQVGDYIFANRDCLAGVSLLSIDGDKDYQQAPFTSVHTPKEIVAMYGDGSIMASGLIVAALEEFDGNLWDACSYFLDPADTGSEKDWLTMRSRQFAERYFNGDVKKMTYCLKDVHNWKRWCDLTREYKEVPWTEFKEEEDNTKVGDTVACGGGTCELTLNV